MARGRPWTKEDDAALRRVVAFNRKWGATIPLVLSELAPGHHTTRLRAFALQLGRSYAAVRKRASRLGLRGRRRAR